MAVYEVDGKAPQVDASAWIAESAQVMGSVRLGAEASVWFGCVLRADITDPSNYRAVEHLDLWLKSRGIIGAAVKAVDVARQTSTGTEDLDAGIVSDRNPCTASLSRTSGAHAGGTTQPAFGRRAVRAGFTPVRSGMRHVSGLDSS